MERGIQIGRLWPTGRRMADTTGEEDEKKNDFFI